MVQTFLSFCIVNVIINVQYFKIWFLVNFSSFNGTKMFPSSQVVNDLLNPAGQNLRIREDAQVTAFYFYSSFNVLYVIKMPVRGLFNLLRL